jgi:hypothetical protein
MIQAGHVARKGDLKMRIKFVGKPEGKRPLGRIDGEKWIL